MERIFEEAWLFADSETGDESGRSVDDHLLALSANGDEEAYAAFVRRHQDRVFTFCQRWMQDTEDAREATQDTFVKAYGAVGRYNAKGQAIAWLYRIALNRCRDHHKSRGAKQRRATQMLEESATSGDGPDETLARHEELEKLHRGIAELPARLRAVVILRGIEGFDIDTCAEILNCSHRAIEGRYYRARKALAEWW